MARARAAANGNGRAHLAQIRAEEEAVESIEAVSGRLRARARWILEGGHAGQRLGATPSGWTLAATLAVFVLADQVLTYAFGVLGPEVRASMGLARPLYGLVVSQRANAAVAVSLTMAAHLHRKKSLRRLLAVQAMAATGVGAVLSAFSGGFWPLFLAVAISGPTAGALWAVHRPMIMDAYPPGSRVRALCVHQGGLVAGALAAPFVVSLLSGPGGLGWRGVLVVVGLAAVVLAVAGLRLRDTPAGRYDTDQVRAAVRADLGVESADPAAADLRFGETLRRLWLIPTVRHMLVAWAVLGIVVAPLPTYMSLFLADHWGMSVTGRAQFIALASVVAVPALVWLARRGDAILQAGRGQLVAVSSTLLLVLAGALIVTSVAPFAAAAFVAYGVAVAATSMLIPALTATMFSIVPPETRPHAGALIATFLVAVGGQGGGTLLGGLDRRFGPAFAIALLAVPAAAASWLVRRAAATAAADEDHMLDQVIEEEEVAALRTRGRRLPMLACRHVDFSYGQLQVLFDVDFTVDDGEVVALLGTNGAGKSTLLRVVSGLGLPSRGSVRYRGADITFLDAERRVPLGILQVPGGKAVFGPMTVAENLRVCGFTHGRSRKTVDAGIEASFNVFPRLAERRNQLASTLSGGEQQMLGLASALILQPQLLLIDELSLGLAPKVVGELLEMVREINRRGTAIVLVEQSVNVALSVVDHAYFMEKGEVRFDGRAADLLDRPDLLRSVFLEGASAGLAGQTQKT